MKSLSALILGLTVGPLYGQQVGSQTIGNLSLRGNINATDQLISGFAIQGSTGTAVLIRGAGPALVPYGVSNPIQRPVLTLFNARGEKIDENVGWSTRPAAELSTIGRRGASFPFEENSNDCGMLVTLAPGLYTAQLGGVSGSTGIGLIELYHGNGFGTVPQDQPHLINVSNRCVVGSGEAVAIAGANLPRNRRLLIRAIGPSLTQFGVFGVLANPKLEIVRPPIATSFIGGGISVLPAVVVTANDDWNNQAPLTLGFDRDTNTYRPIVGVAWSGSADEIRAAASKCGAFPIAMASPQARITLVTPENTAYRFVVQVMNVCKDVGLKRVAISSKGPNKSPEPTPTAVTPRATEGKSK